MNITITGIENVDTKDAKLLLATIERAQRFQSVRDATLQTSQRQTSGWLEYLLVLQLENNRSLTIGCIQRSLGAECEFHS